MLGVNAEEMATVLSRVKTLDLRYVNLTQEQWQKLLEKIPIEGRCDEINLQLDSFSLDNLSAETLAKGWGCVKLSLIHI